MLPRIEWFLQYLFINLNKWFHHCKNTYFCEYRQA